jgi:LuxR family transcriptional regulator, maltose regulon positive regulatory protein
VTVRAGVELDQAPAPSRLVTWFVPFARICRDTGGPWFNWSVGGSTGAKRVGSNGPARIGAHAGLVPRAGLIGELRDASDIPVLLVVAGAGYGKTTLVSQWLRDDHRSVAWLTVSREHDDPAVLLADIVHVLDEFEPLEPRAKQRLAATTIDFSAVLVPRLERTIVERARPFVLVLDDVDQVRRRDARALVGVLARCVPPGSQLVLVARSEPEIGLARMRADRRVHTIAAPSLALDRAETASMFEAAGLKLPAGVVDRLWERTEGWPVGVYLATLAIAEDDDAVATAERFAGDDRIVSEYIHDELMARLPRRVREFLLSASVLDELSVPACDFVRKADDSERLLTEANRAFQLLIPLDRNGATYRMHQLLRDTMRAELAHKSPAREVALSLRAADWYESRGDFDRGIDRLQHAGAEDRAEALIWRATPHFVGFGRTATVDRWLEVYTHDHIVSRPALTAASAWCALTNGDMPSLRYWANVASQFPEHALLPDGAPVAATAALLRAVIGGGGIESMRSDAGIAYELDLPRSPYRAVARYLEGSALRIQGRRAEARDRLEEGEAIGALLLPAAQANCLAQLAALALDEGDPDTAARRVEQFESIIERYGLNERPALGSSFAIGALINARSGDAPHARAQAKHALFLVSMLSTVAPWITVECRIYLARAFLLLGDVGLARVIAREANDLLELVPDGEPLRERLDDFERTIAVEPIPIGVLATPMTPAEMRVLRYLPTHLTFGAIADELYVSRNTVKTQAISIYRKLGVSSRDPAVAAARSLGLLGD